ncbi:hypothetical protein ABUU59_00305, partial [Escherichia coli]
QKQKKLIMLPSETMIWQPEFTDKTLSRKPGAVQVCGVDWQQVKGHDLAKWVYPEKTADAQNNAITQ